MFIGEIWGKVTSLIVSDFEIKFQKNELDKLIPSFPLKHVITSTNNKLQKFHNNQVIMTIINLEENIQIKGQSVTGLRFYYSVKISFFDLK